MSTGRGRELFGGVELRFQRVIVLSLVFVRNYSLVLLKIMVLIPEQLLMCCFYNPVVKSQTLMIVSLAALIRSFSFGEKQRAVTVHPMRPFKQNRFDPSFKSHIFMWICSQT